MNLADPVDAPDCAPEKLFAPGRSAACMGAVALISMLAFESIAVATAMPAVAEALHGLPYYALAFGATLATSVLGMTAAGQLCDKRGPYRAALAGLAAFLAGLLLAGFASSIGAAPSPTWDATPKRGVVSATTAISSICS